MAITTQLKYGSKGDEVKELQTALNNNGYNLDVDGSYGSKTQAAVKDYQTKNNLKVDGVVGNQTWGSLFPTETDGSTGENASNATTTTKKTALQLAMDSAPKYNPDSDLVTQAKAALEAHLSSKPGEYQSPYQQQINDTLDKILNREKFSYDLNGDALYQQYKNQYSTLGQQAMMDTMGQAAALTGGYGNSYAQNAGQQAYQGYLQQLNDKVPELAQLAYDMYSREGDELLNQYSLYADRENADYNRYRDTLNDYYTNLDFLTNQYQNERNFDYQNYQDQLSSAMWQSEFDEAMRQFNVAKGLAGSSGGSGGSRSSSGKDSSNKNNGGLSTEQIKILQGYYGVPMDGSWGSQSKAAAGGLSAEAAWAILPEAEKGSYKDNTYTTSTSTSDSKGWYDYDNDTYNDVVKSDGGYYSEALSDLKEMKKKNGSNKDAESFLLEMVGNNLISRSDYLSLYNKYRDNKL